MVSSRRSMRIATALTVLAAPQVSNAQQHVDIDCGRHAEVRGLDALFRAIGCIFGGCPTRAEITAACSRPAPPTPPPPVPPPPLPPPPASTCNRGPFVVFFDYQEEQISPEAAQLLDSSVSAYANCGPVRIQLDGHDDLSGSDSESLDLSERRNEAVRGYLVSRGIPVGVINSKAYGESRPRVPTEDGVREQQNRRVEITFGDGSGD